MNKQEKTTARANRSKYLLLIKANFYLNTGKKERVFSTLIFCDSVKVLLIISLLCFSSDNHTRLYSNIFTIKVLYKRQKRTNWSLSRAKDLINSTSFIFLDATYLLDRFCPTSGALSFFLFIPSFSSWPFNDFI